MTWLLVLGGAVGAVFLLTVLFGAPYVPTKRRDIVTSFDELYAVGPGDTLVDIGSGDGVVLREASRRGATAVGIEINPMLVWISRLLSRRQADVRVRMANYMTVDLPAETTIVYLFGEGYRLARVDQWLATQVEKLGKPVYVMSYGFALPERQPILELRAHRLYLVEPLQSREA